MAKSPWNGALSLPYTDRRILPGEPFSFSLKVLEGSLRGTSFKKSPSSSSIT
jgi:hypothetical protein